VEGLRDKKRGVHEEELTAAHRGKGAPEEKKLSSALRAAGWPSGKKKSEALSVGGVSQDIFIQNPLG